MFTKTEIHITKTTAIKKEKSNTQLYSNRPQYFIIHLFIYLFVIISPTQSI